MTLVEPNKSEAKKCFGCTKSCVHIDLRWIPTNLREHFRGLETRSIVALRVAAQMLHHPIVQFITVLTILWA
jgi:hypothetical protein